MQAGALPDRVRAARARRVLLGANAALLLGVAVPGIAHAQTDSSVLIDTAIPDNFDRDRNVSVLERPHPDYSALDIRLGSLLFAPQVETGIGATSNVYLDRSGRSDGFVYAAPSAQLRSDWARDQVLLSAGTLFRRFFNETRRNETSYNLRALGAKDIGPNYTVTIEGQYAKLYETPDTGAIDASLSVLSSYRRNFLTARAQYRGGRSRATVAFDRTGFSFDEIDRGNGLIDQRSRDRIVSRGTGEYQYALSPSLSVYGQASYNAIDYSYALPGGAPNRDSTGWRVIGGFNFDLAGLVRGKLGLGYINRNFRSPGFRDAQGLSAEALVEYFPTPLTTVSLTLGRTLQDTNISTSGAYFDNRIQARVDHEILENLVVGGSVEYRHQNYVASTARTNYYRAGANARYLLSRFVTVSPVLLFQKRGRDIANSGEFNEVRGQIAVTLRR